MNASVRDCLVTGYEPLVATLDLPDPDDFVLDRIELCERVVVEAVRRIADSRRAPPTSVSEVLDALERCGLRKSVAALRSRQE
ncbi:hypothetical protein ACIA2T_38295 [Amycolatopsis japonica]|uniref:hypothetical protein n=1 Tax=Amycolatopsis japonica TaxID=208439 RepID=UPI003787DB94